MPVVWTSRGGNESAMDSLILELRRRFLRGLYPEEGSGAWCEKKWRGVDVKQGFVGGS